MLLEDKSAVNYGGSGAIGGAAARVFAREGASVFLVGRTQARLDMVASDIVAAGGKVETAKLEDTRVTLDIQAQQDGTLLTLTHERLPSGQFQSHHQGWPSILAKLAPAVLS